MRNLIPLCDSLLYSILKSLVKPGVVFTLRFTLSMSTENRRIKQSKGRVRRLTVGEVVVVGQPEEVAYPLRREQFDMLCEGEALTNDARWRDVSLSVSVAALMGLMAQIMTLDWNHALGTGEKMVLILTGILAVLFLSSSVLFVYVCIRVRRQITKSGYARIKAKIEHYFTTRGV